MLVFLFIKVYFYKMTNQYKNKNHIYMLLIYILVGIIVFIFSSNFDLLEKYYEFSRNHENLEIDEFVIISIYSTIFVLIIFTMQNISLKKLNKKNKMLIEEQGLILRESRHRIKNHLLNISSMLCLEYKHHPNMEVQEIYQKVKHRITGISALYEQLTHSIDNETIEFSDHLKKIVSLTKDSYYINQGSINISKSAKINIDSKRMFYLSIIITEILTNSIKYGTSEDEKLIIDIQTVVDNKNIQIVISNNGKLPKEFDIHHSNGFGYGLIKILADQLKSKYSLKESDFGTTFSLDFPIKKAVEK